MLTYWETMTAIQSNVPVNDSYAKLWGRKSRGGYTVVTYTGTLPAVLTGTEAGYLHKYKIYGNTEQTGTPTPENPIVPSECGERTENLFDYQTMAVSGISRYLTATGQEVTITGWRISDYIPCNGKEFTINKIGGDSPAICLYDENKQFLTGKSYRTGGVTVKLPVTISSVADAKYIRFSYVTLSDDLSEIIIAEGTTALPYEPYGYKLPLTSGSTPVDIYIGDDTLSTEEYVDSGTGKIYRRQNLYDINATDTSKGYLSESYLYGNTIGSNPNWFVSEYMPISADTDYVASGLIDVGTSGVIATINIYDNNKQLERYKTIDSSGDTEINSGVNGAFIRISARNEHKNTVVVKTKNAVPTDPPIPFPQIPTSAGSTTIGWAGEGLAPSKVELEYEKRR